MSCNQLCMYNTLKGCKVEEMKGVCPMVQAGEANKKYLANPKPLVRTGDWIERGTKLYAVVIADCNIFVVCPLRYSKREKSFIVKYSRPEIYANQARINTLTELGFREVANEYLFKMLVAKP